MTKYILSIKKIEELNNDRFLERNFHNTILFEAEISSDGTIEILRHLYDLEKRENKKPI